MLFMRNLFERKKKAREDSEMTTEKTIDALKPVDMLKSITYKEYWKQIKDLENDYFEIKSYNVVSYVTLEITTKRKNNIVDDEQTVQIPLLPNINIPLFKKEGNFRFESDDPSEEEYMRSLNRFILLTIQLRKTNILSRYEKTYCLKLKGDAKEAETIKLAEGVEAKLPQIEGRQLYRTTKTNYFGFRGKIDMNNPYHECECVFVLTTRNRMDDEFYGLKEHATPCFSDETLEFLHIDKNALLEKFELN